MIVNSECVSFGLDKRNLGLSLFRIEKAILCMALN
jgi:hypothetical protein